jgi:hypothetical protein
LLTQCCGAGNCYFSHYGLSQGTNQTNHLPTLAQRTIAVVNGTYNVA